MIKTMERIRIDRDGNGFTARLGRFGKVVARLRGSPIIVGTDEDQQRDTSFPVRTFKGHSATWVEGNSPREAGSITPCTDRADHMENRRASVRPPEQSY